MHAKLYFFFTMCTIYTSSDQDVQIFLYGNVVLLG